MTLINGQQQDSLAVANRALHYGDGLFETFAVQEGQPLAWDRHIVRLQSGCERLAIKCPDIARLQAEALQICAGIQLAVLKLIISRGEGGRGYQPPLAAQTTRIFSLHDWPNYPGEHQQEGIKATICRMRLGNVPTLAGIKHLNRLEQVLLKQELSTSACAEAIVMDIGDRVVEGTMSNIFLVKNGQLFTPELSRAGVAGVIRGRILELGRDLDMGHAVRDIVLDDVLHADEVFFCNSVAGIWPVILIDQTSYNVGPYTRQLQRKLLDEKLIVMT